MSFKTLPAELYDAILIHVPSSEIQQTVLAVTRAIPLSPVPLYHLFRSIRIRRAQQAILLYRRLRRRKTDENGSSAPNSVSDSEPEQIGAWVKEFSVETWSVDADIVINVVRLLPRLQSLNIWVGPNNFAPEHLEELLSKPLVGLRYLAIRFRPYVQKATYYQFLKGAYFDSTLLALSRWPSSLLPTLSIVQDPLDPGGVGKQTFAQPLVFFRLDPYLSILLHSPALSSSLTALRLRIPSRPVARSLCSSAAHGTDSYPMISKAPPNLKFLDLATCGVLESEVDTILVRFTTLKHIILDGCAVLRGELREGEWNALGKRCALVGVRRAKERERALKALLEARSSDGGPDLGLGPNNATRNVKRGRRGLATATISFRSPDPIVASSSSRPVLRNQTVQITKKSASKIRILPSLPSLLSVSITISPMVKEDKYPVIRAEFEAGWSEGIALLAVTRARLRTSSKNGFRIMRSLTTDENEQTDGGESDEGLEGLEDVDHDDDNAFGMAFNDDGVSIGLKPPIICFAGRSRDGPHENNCGHSIGWELMGDELYLDK